ncbi:hypothetical protein CXZ10_05795 [Pleomorphomonas diazotrophica]|uniref:LamG domain-containing protein n=1 Tax=Pleomorphomonas diazotrophica TaxID=1166257 RepID=A0A1I4Q9R2_9HYPH|nr:hypothetical protein [Pleomorphomonas diazotrophica]PKR90861.1 hypothetical protein CXZ10_05795 [Pleomorphomonas diazotrophica]SFM36415.1 hypothetical protein SAMN05192571_101153 [Pleomorphomonas diazotrophica]
MTTYSPFLQLPVAIANGQGPLVSLADCRPIFPTSIETDAYGHWDFGGDAVSLNSLIDGKALTPAATAPVYNSDSIKLVDGGMNGLLTDLDDRAAMTVCLVVKLIDPGSPTSQVVFASTITSNVPASGGSMGYLDRDAAGQFRFTSLRRPASGLVGSNFPVASNTDKWAFVGFAADDASGRVVYYGTFGTSTEGSGFTKTLASPMRKVSIGNASYSSAQYLYGPQLAEAIIFTGRKTAAEMAAIAARSKTRMQRKGILLANV